MITIIAEKPSVAREIARIAGATARRDGYIEGNGYTVTWAIGHLVTLAMPEQYGIEGFRSEDLPIIPGNFKLVPRQIKEHGKTKPDPAALKQLKIIKELFDKCDSIIVATDAGREGELIFRYIYSYLECSKPFDRLWISSLTDKAIREGLQNLKPGARYDNLYLAAKARSEADWLLGLNSSRALGIAAGRGTYSLGRVQTPTLAMICKRFLDNKHFVSSKYWKLKAETEKDGVPFDIMATGQFDNYEQALETLQRVKSAGNTDVTKMQRREVTQEPPLLYDLTTLQKEANTRHGFTADNTLSIAQKLYEAKLITYPRTGSRYIPGDVFDEITPLIHSIAGHDRFGRYAADLSVQPHGRHSVDDTKVTDHHAIIITGNQAKGLSGDEETIYDMIAARLLETFSKPCIKDVITVSIDCGGIEFSVKSSVTRQPGWRKVTGENSEQEAGGEDYVQNLPALSPGDRLTVTTHALLEKQTKPKPLHTEASLLSAMENAGDNVEDRDERSAMKDSGIGTPATRAAIIETLFAREYIRREKKNLVPTDKGLAVYDAVKDKKIANVAMTGQWENALSKIETGETNAGLFRKGIEEYTVQATAELLSVRISASGANGCACPKCKIGEVAVYAKVAKCGNPDCGLAVFREKSGKILTCDQITELLKKGRTPVIKGFKSKEGKPFEAALAFDREFRVTFVFPEKKTKGAPREKR